MARMILRKDTAANFASQNPLILEGEYALETDTRKYKQGDGVNPYNALPYCNPEVVQELGNSLIATISQKVLTEKLTETKELVNIFKRQEKLI